MDIIINETNSCAQLTYLRHGVDLTSVLVDKSGALHHDFEWDAASESWRCGSATYHYWLAVIKAYEIMDDRISSLCAEHGMRDVYAVVVYAIAGNSDIASIPRSVHAYLDQAFGENN